MAVETLEKHACFGGSLRFLRHESAELGVPATFGVFLPPGIGNAREAGARLPVIHLLAGLHGDERSFLTKSGIVRLAAERGIALVAPDTSPRGAGIPGEEEGGPPGIGASFYVDATREPWSRHYRMASYIGAELPALTEALFPLDPARRGIIGHSMGGMGALIQALGHPERWRTVSVFAPVCFPSAVPGGQKAFDAYFGGDPSKWKEYDPTVMLRSGKRHPSTILADLGLQDPYLADLRLDALNEAARESGQKLDLRRHDEYDHSYWFVQSFIADHVAHHAAGLS